MHFSSAPCVLHAQPPHSPGFDLPNNISTYKKEVTSYFCMVKVKLSLCFFNRTPYNEGILREWRYSSMHYLTSALDGGEWSASRPGRFTPRERAPGVHWIGGWVDPRAVLKRWWREKFPGPAGKWTLNPDCPARSLVAVPTELVDGNKSFLK
jgi:hypothetical protein